ncbi:MAG: nickel-dependent hydrogenase large subunit [Hydrogenobaculum sp.]
MKITKTILNRLEGEVELKLEYSKGKIAKAYILGTSYRDFSNILKTKPYLDSIILTPRVCGICGHAHLMASVQAIEDAYKKEYRDFHLSTKAYLVRYITLLSEMIQNHIRWFYAYFMSEIPKLDKDMVDYLPFEGEKWKRGIAISNYPIKIIALFGGQWPHSSYAVPGGITSDFTYYELNTAKSFCTQLLKSIETYIIGMPTDKYLSFSKDELLSYEEGDIGDFVKLSSTFDFFHKGIAYKRFLTGGSIKGYVGAVVFENGIKESFDVKNIDTKEHEFKKVKEITGVVYNKKRFETGPLARKINSSNSLFLELLEEFGDSLFLRVMARIDEIVSLTLLIKDALDSINIKEPSYIKPPIKEPFTGKGVGVVEAARGTLIHEINIENGLVKDYKIVTPTLWNLGSYDENMSPAQESIVGLSSDVEAYLSLRSFDVCASCVSY